MRWLVPVVYLLILTALAAHGQDKEATDKRNLSYPVCSAIHDKQQELNETTKALCGTNATAPDVVTNRKLVTWTSVNLTRFAQTTFHTIGTLSYEIPKIVPDDAIEVLIFAHFYAGGSSGGTSYFKIYTEGDNGEQYVKYMALLGSSHSNYYSSSNNLWFPMTSSRRIFLNVPHALGGYIGGDLNLIGYR